MYIDLYGTGTDPSGATQSINKEGLEIPASDRDATHQKLQVTIDNLDPNRHYGVFYPRAGGNELGRMPYAGPPGVGSRSVRGAPSSAGSAAGLRSSASFAAANTGGRESRWRRTSGSDLKGRSRYGLTTN